MVRVTLRHASIRSSRSGYDKLEIIVVDNGSSDRSVDYFRRKCEGWRGKIEVISLSKNNGPAAARNRGARIALGRFMLPR